MSALHDWYPTRDEWEDEGRALDDVLEGRVRPQTEPAPDTQIDLPPGFAPWPLTEAKAKAAAKETRRLCGVTARQVAVQNNRLRVLLGVQRTEAAREARRAQGEATAVRIRAELAAAPAGKLEAAVEGVCASLGVSRRTLFRAKSRPAIRE